MDASTRDRNCAHKPKHSAKKKIPALDLFGNVGFLQKFQGVTARAWLPVKRSNDVYSIQPRRL
jgi:hypothetical protein